MRNMAVLHSPAFSYPLPVLVRVLFNLLIFKGKILYYNKYKRLFRAESKIWQNLFRAKKQNTAIYRERKTPAPLIFQETKGFVGFIK